MANWIWQSKKEDEEGFSLVELLIVVIIMGILAAIAIPLFLSQRAKAEDAKTEAVVETLGKELATWWTGNYAPPVIRVEPSTHLYPGFHILADAGDPSTKDTLATPLPPGLKSTISGATSGTPVGWVTSGTDKTSWCFAAFNKDGKVKSYKVSATKGLEPVQESDTATAISAAICP
ncbi:MAG: type II secretion system GspH family protein [Bifidobacteriaceae bacterium]|jgi:prepilin-type N-terminal cleavage/methylation domain-containing protein|nr:type II secretion system GspH family protein [Bifidobacteriaceae bacterium]